MSDEQTGRGRGGRGHGAHSHGRTGKSAPNSSSVKKRLRALERLLHKGGLPDDVRRSKEAEIASLKIETAKNNRVQRERHFSKKYHGVKFIEKQKVERRIAKLKRELSEQSFTSGQTNTEKELREAEEDLLYIRHFPRSKKYLSLFPGTDGDDPFVVKRRQQIRSMILRRVAEGLPMGRVDKMDDEDEDEEQGLDVGQAELEDDSFFMQEEAGEDDDKSGAAAVASLGSKRERSQMEAGALGKKAKKKRKAQEG
eukprot:CAMPEP_0174737872 /NCGR_PEP_ID=MMETSP1094-20130205/68985_1 /TAXON_ID=156173 /ORGANISM="Chrysochromulina brevifilum, Strain UTEX LB 985" /LENGTH=253 /DNA_ID=CAMNT_0015941169 /DNA_START=29 /DNA_END=790 /DNA_ORIENTATION=-